MKTFSRSRFFAVNLSVLAVLGLLIAALPAAALPITWQILPFPTDSDWPGPQGQPAITNGNQVILDGRPVRTVDSYFDPVTISFDVSLQARNTDDGALWMTLIPLGQPPTVASFTNGTLFQLGFENYGTDTMGFYARNPSGPNTTLWQTAYHVYAVTNYHIIVGVAASGALSLNVNGQSFAMPGSAVSSVNPFQIELEGWQPDAIWTVSNFAVVPEPSVLTMSALGLAGLAFVARRRRGN